MAELQEMELLMQLMMEQGMFGEEDQGMGFGTKAAIGAAGAGAFVGASPFRREAMAQLMFGRDGATRGELMKALGAGFKEQGRAVKENPMALVFGADRKQRGRQAVIDDLPKGEGARRFQKVVNRGKLPSGALTSPKNRALATQLTGGSITKLAGKGATLGGRLLAGSGIASMLWLAYEVAKLGKTKLIDEPKQRDAREMEMMNGLLRGGPSMENSFAGQYLKGEGQLASPDFSRPEDALVASLIQRHDIAKLQGAAKQKPALTQAQAINIIQGIGG